MVVPAAVEDLDEPHVALRHAAGENATGRERAGRADIRPVRVEHVLGLVARSTRAGTEVCMRNAISYFAMRVVDSGSPSRSNCVSLSSLRPSSMRRRAGGVDAVGIRQEQHRVPLGRGRDSLVLLGRKPLPQRREKRAWAFSLPVHAGVITTKAGRFSLRLPKP